MTARDSDWDGVRLHVVTGKGGTGKTTVAAALALALAHAGRKVLLIEAEGRQGIARLFDRPPLPYAERKIAIGPGDSYGLSVSCVVWPARTSLKPGQRGVPDAVVAANEEAELWKL